MDTTIKEPVNLILASDQSLRSTGVCVLTDKEEIVLATTIDPPETLPSVAQLAYIRDSIRTILERYPGVRACVMEAYSFGSVNRKFTLGEVAGTIKLFLHDCGLPVTQVAPKQLKKFMTGRGSADKALVIKAVNSYFKTQITNDNIADATGLALIGVRLFTGLPDNVRHRQDVLTTLYRQ